MFLSVFDIFKIGIGPSSSHTVGPDGGRRAAFSQRGPRAARRRGRGGSTVSLHGSLAFTGKGHGTDRAIALGLAGETPDDRRPGPRPRAACRARRGEVASPPRPAGSRLRSGSRHSSSTTARRCPATPTAWSSGARRRRSGAHRATYYSVGGGFVLTARRAAAAAIEGSPTPRRRPTCPIPSPPLPRCWRWATPRASRSPR